MTENNNKTRREDIESVVWSACDIFRGAMDSSIYVELVSTSTQKQPSKIAVK